MSRLIQAFSIYIIFSISFLHVKAEGSKNLRPVYTQTGFITINTPGYGNFANETANANERLQFTIANLNERVYFAFGHIKLGNINTHDEIIANPLDTVNYRIVDETNTVVAVGFVPITGGGFIGDGSALGHSDLLAGPFEITGAGFNSLKFIPPAIGNYHIEFNLGQFGNGDNSHFTFQLFDITVSSSKGAFDSDLIDPAPATGTPILGRLWSKNWLLSNGSLAVGQNTQVFYTYSADSVVSSVTHLNFNPDQYRISANSYGITNTSNPGFDRPSRTGIFSEGEFPVFISPPDIAAFPSGNIASLTQPVTFTQCSNNDYCINIHSNGEAYTEVVLDFNGNGFYDPASQDLILFDVPVNQGFNCIPWNGIDGLNNPVGPGITINVIVNFKSGLVNWMLYDVEEHTPGMVVQTVRPLFTAFPLSPICPTFWADNLIPPTNTLPSNILGCVPTPGNGCHPWTGRGAQGSEETFNTFYYSSITNTTASLTTLDLAFDLGPDRAICQNDTIYLVAGAGFDTYTWNTGDTNDSIMVLTPGFYQVTATKNGCVISDSVTISLGLELNLGADTTLCPGESLTLTITIDQAQILWSDGSSQTNFTIVGPGNYWVEIQKQGCTVSDTITVNYQPTVLQPILGNDTLICSFAPYPVSLNYPGANITWTGGVNGPDFTYPSPGTYNVSVAYGRCVTNDSIIITVPPTFSLGNDTTRCDIHPITIGVNLPNTTYLWNNGATQARITVNQSGNYFVNANYFNCTLVDSINLTFLPTYTNPFRADSSLCNSTEIKLTNLYDTVPHIWQDGSIGREFTVNKTGTYFITYNRQCYFSDTVTYTFGECPTLVNVFTPNNDGFNDELIFQDLGPWNYELTIFNRWGQIVFETNSPKGIYWDGRSPAGAILPQGTYFYELNDTSRNKKFKGIVTLLR
jgi:gliding motility-associated-like protein